MEAALYWPGKATMVLRFSTDFHRINREIMHASQELLLLPAASHSTKGFFRSMLHPVWKAATDVHATRTCSFSFIVVGRENSGGG